MNLPDLGALKDEAVGAVERLRAPVQPPDFQASDPASAGGASTPLLWLAISLVVEYGAVVAAAALFGLASAKWFMGNSVAQTAFVAIQVPLIGLLLNYRSRNKRMAADLAVAHVQAQASIATAVVVPPVPPATATATATVEEKS